MTDKELFTNALLLLTQATYAAAKLINDKDIDSFRADFSPIVDKAEILVAMSEANENTEH